VTGGRVGVELEVGAGQGGGLVRLGALASAEIDLPGVGGSVRRAGLTIDLVLRLDRGGNVGGLFDLVVQPAPPTGMSLELGPGGPFTGGGYLERTDAPRGFRGTFAVDLGVIAVTAYASVTTDPPLSVLVLLTGEFATPIQLSFGFTLIGVGGLVGVERGVNQEAMSAAVASGDAALVLFPHDPVGDAARILSVLDQVFPPRPGQFVVGPLLKLGWGTPTLISATIGVFVSSEGSVTLLGRLLVALPTEDLALVRVEVLVHGWVDSSGVAIDGSLVNSRFAFVGLGGDFRLRLQGDVMALSAGGFHPAFAPPSGMTGMRRLTADLTGTDNPMLRFEGYFAVTPSTVQFGAALHLLLDLGFARIEGHAQFDALITLDPFGFRCEFSASLHVEVLDQNLLGIDIHLAFSGPNRWELHGYASVSILWWDVDLPVDLAWGDPPPEALASADPVEVLRRELARPQSWQSAAPTHSRTMILVRPDAATDSTLLHPTGTLAVAQDAVPLDVVISRFAGGRLPAPQRLTIVGVTVDGAEAELDDVRRSFAATQFLELDSAARLANPGFTSWSAGRAVTAAGVGAPPAPVTVELTYEDSVLGYDDGRSFFARTSFAVLAEQATAHVAAGAAGRAAASRGALETAAVTLSDVAAMTWV
jgi:hypothetical protein